MKIYLIDYVESNPRIMSIEAVEKETFWLCDRDTAKVEAGGPRFWVPNMVPKGDISIYLTLEDAVAKLVGMVERDIAKRQDGIQKLYGHIGKLEELVR